MCLIDFTIASKARIMHAKLCRIEKELREIFEFCERDMEPILKVIEECKKDLEGLIEYHTPPAIIDKEELNRMVRELEKWISEGRTTEEVDIDG